jgi:hypothetical protein
MVVLERQRYMHVVELGPRVPTQHKHRQLKKDREREREAKQAQMQLKEMAGQISGMRDEMQELRWILHAAVAELRNNGTSSMAPLADRAGGASNAIVAGEASAASAASAASEASEDSEGSD